MQDRIGSFVSAILHADGCGSVGMSDLYVGAEGYGRDVTDTVQKFLKNLGYIEDDMDYLLPACAKFWHENQLGSLTVFPFSLANIAVHELLNSFNCWGKPLRELAFFLPKSQKVRNHVYNRKKAKVYGSQIGYVIFQGGGPFILEDSPDLVEEALRKLGYIDDDLNDDMFEAMFCLMNASENKNSLRKQGFLPCPTDLSRNVALKLRRAFLSNKFKGLWQIMNRSSNAMQSILPALEKAKLLSKNGSHSQHEIFDAMQVYSAKHRLPPMRTFNGLAWRVRRHLIKDPSDRADVEFLR